MMRSTFDVWGLRSGNGLLFHTLFPVEKLEFSLAYCSLNRWPYFQQN